MNGCFHVFKVDIDITGNSNYFGNASCCCSQNIISVSKSFREVQVSEHFSKFLVTDDDNCINILFQQFYSFVSLLLSSLAFKFERHSNNCNCENSHFSCSLCNDRRCTSSGSSTHTCCYENHSGIRK